MEVHVGWRNEASRDLREAVDYDDYSHYVYYTRFGQREKQLAS